MRAHTHTPKKKPHIIEWESRRWGQGNVEMSQVKHELLWDGGQKIILQNSVQVSF